MGTTDVQVFLSWPGLPLRSLALPEAPNAFSFMAAPVEAGAPCSNADVPDSPQPAISQIAERLSTNSHSESGARQSSR